MLDAINSLSCDIRAWAVDDEYVGIEQAHMPKEKIQTIVPEMRPQLQGYKLKLTQTIAHSNPMHSALNKAWLTPLFKLCT